MLKWLERVAWIAGILLLAIYAGARASAERARLEGIATVEEARAALASERSSAGSDLQQHAPDTSLWSPSRIEAWREASSAR